MLNGVYEIATPSLMDMYKFTISSQGNLMVFGPPGIGKTHMAKTATRSSGLEYVYLDLSVLEAPDLLGLPYINEEERVSEYAPPAYLPRRKEGETPRVLIVDEVDKAKPELQNPMLELFEERSINGIPLNFQAIIATGNLPDDNSHSQPISHALTNRCLVYKVGFDFEAWQEWAASAQINPLVVGFIGRNREWALRKTDDSDETAYANPSPRSWTRAGQDLDRLPPSTDVDLQTQIVAGRVGTEAAARFKTWLVHYRFIEPMLEKLVKDGTHPSGKGKELELDKTLVLAISGIGEIAKAAARSESTEKVQKVAHNVSNWVKTLPPDICVAAIKTSATQELIRNHNLVSVSDFYALFQKVCNTLDRDS